MKKIFFLSLALVALVSCKNAEQEPTPDIPNQPDGAILVRSGGVFSVDVTKAGARPIDGGSFVLKGETPGDKIGVLAVYSTDPTVDLSADPKPTDKPNWTTIQFENLPAEADKAVTGLTGVVDFQWNNGEYQFFDKGKAIHLFAYYPYTDGTTAAEGVTYTKNSTAGDVGGAKPTISVELQDESITEAATPTLKQPDVMFARHADGLLISSTDQSEAPVPINRTSKEANMRLKFKHALSQLVFKIQKSAEVKSDVYLKSLEIRVPKKATYTLGDAVMTPTVAATTDAADFVTYTIAPTGADGLQIGDLEADDAGAVIVNALPLMMFPFTKAELEKCTMKMQLKFSDYGIVDFPLTSTGNTNKMTLPGFGADGSKGMTQGAKNTVVMTVNHVGIQLQGVVAPWDVKTHDKDIVLE